MDPLGFRPLYPCADYRLLRSNILLNTEGEVVDHPAPETPPWVHTSYDSPCTVE